MGFQVQFGAGAYQGQGWVGDANGSGQVLLYDGAGNALARQNNTAPAVGTTPWIVPTGGVDSDGYFRATRASMFGTVRNTSDTLLFYDAFEGTNINLNWTQSLTTFTLAQAVGTGLTMNNGSGTAANSYAILTNIRQFAKLQRQPLVFMMRAKVTNLNPVHTIIELGFGAPTTTTAIVSNGCFFRQRADGQWQAVVSYNGTETLTNITGPDATNEYYNYSIFIDDDSARFIIQEPDGTVKSDTYVSLGLVATPAIWAVSHLPSFARVYVDPTGGGTAAQLVISSHEVSMMDVLTNQPWREQLALSAKGAAYNPLSQAQAPAFSVSAAPAGGTPTNTTALYTTLGGEYIATMTAASENYLGVFGFQVPAPYTLVVTGMYLAVPVVSTTWNIATTIPTVEPSFIASGVANPATAQNLKSANALGFFAGTSLTAAAGTLLSGQPISWQPRTPLVVQAGLYLHLGWKVLLGGAVTAGAIRGNWLVDGYFV